jgi:hypothetical protein
MTLLIVSRKATANINSLIYFDSCDGMKMDIAYFSNKMSWLQFI